MAKLLSLIITVLITVGACSTDSETDIRTVFDSQDVLKLKTSFEHLSGHTIRLWADSSSIYLSSAPDFRIHVYDYLGKKKRILGKKGDSPAENGSIWYFGIDDTKQKYWVHDYPKQLLKSYDLKSDLLISTKKVITINNVLYAGKNMFVVPRNDEINGSYILSVYDTKSGMYIKDFDLLKVLDNSERKSMKHLEFLFEGNFCRNNGFGVYYCYSAGVFFLINFSDLSIKVINDVRNLPLPVTVVQNQEVQLKPKQVGTISATMDDNYLYSLSTKDASDTRAKGKFQIDVYNLATCSYQGSFDMKRWNGEDRPSTIATSQGKLIVQFESETIAIYNVDIKKLNATR